MAHKAADSPYTCSNILRCVCVGVKARDGVFHSIIIGVRHSIYGALSIGESA